MSVIAFPTKQQPQPTKPKPEVYRIESTSDGFTVLTFIGNTGNTMFLKMNENAVLHLIQKLQRSIGR
jgi:hypothetical protein